MSEKTKKKTHHAVDPGHGHGGGGGGGHEGGGEENWLVSYADMMTLLVGFFVILLSFSKIDQDEFEKVKKAATEQFGGIYQIPFGELADRLRHEIEKSGLGDQFVIKQTAEGVEIAFHGTVFFDTGSVDLKPTATELLNKLIPVIKAEAQHFKILIEGHTDDVPISVGSKYRTNWDLSSLRACHVLEEFERAGFSKKQLTAIGYADAYPIAPNRDAKGIAIPENQSQNRRVLIKVLSADASVLEGEASPPTESSGSKH